MARVNGGGYLALLGALAGQRLLELGWSNRNLRRSTPGRTASPATFPLMVALNVALFALPMFTRYRRPQPPGPLRAAAGGALVTAVGLRLWSIVSLGTHWNVRGTVAADLQPVRRGPYRWVRHPNYDALALEFAAIPLLGGGYLEAVLLSGLNAAVLWPRIRAEEALLGAIPAYAEAFAGVPRFLPRQRRRERSEPGDGKPVSDR